LGYEVTVTVKSKSLKESGLKAHKVEESKEPRSKEGKEQMRELGRDLENRKDLESISLHVAGV
jgi:hypothetical protein